MEDLYVLYSIHIVQSRSYIVWYVGASAGPKLSAFPKSFVKQQQPWRCYRKPKTLGSCKTRTKNCFVFKGDRNRTWADAGCCFWYGLGVVSNSRHRLLYTDLVLRLDVFFVWCQHSTLTFDAKPLNTKQAAGPAAAILNIKIWLGKRKGYVLDYGAWGDRGRPFSTPRIFILAAVSVEVVSSAQLAGSLPRPACLPKLRPIGRQTGISKKACHFKAGFVAVIIITSRVCIRTLLLVCGALHIYICIHNCVIVKHCA